MNKQENSDNKEPEQGAVEFIFHGLNRLLQNFRLSRLV